MTITCTFTASPWDDALASLSAEPYYLGIAEFRRAVSRLQRLAGLERCTDELHGATTDPGADVAHTLASSPIAWDDAAGEWTAAGLGKALEDVAPPSDGWAMTARMCAKRARGEHKLSHVVGLGQAERRFIVGPVPVPADATTYVVVPEATHAERVLTWRGITCTWRVQGGTLGAYQAFWYPVTTPERTVPVVTLPARVSQYVPAPSAAPVDMVHVPATDRAWLLPANHPELRSARVASEHTPLLGTLLEGLPSVTTLEARMSRGGRLAFTYDRETGQTWCPADVGTLGLGERRVLVTEADRLQLAQVASLGKRASVKREAHGRNAAKRERRATQVPADKLSDSFKRQVRRLGLGEAIDRARAQAERAYAAHLATLGTAQVPDRDDDA